MKNVVGLFDTMSDAEAVVRELRSAGVADADISFAGRNSDQATMESNQYIGEGHSEAAEGAGFGATGGTVVGGLTGLLVGLGALVIPGVGPVIAAGTLATALGSAALGAGIGAATGGLLGALVGAGIPEEDANVYSEGIRRGGALVMAKVDDAQVDTALDIMERHNVVDIDERSGTYRETGWSRYDESAGPYSATSSTSTVGDADRVPGESDYDRSSKIGTAGGALAGAATGAAIGSAGGPVGTVIGGVAGAVTGGGVGAAGDAAGVEATDNDTTRTGDYNANTVGSTYGSTAGSTTDSSYSSVDTGYRGSGDTDRVPDGDDYDRSSKIGTAGGALAGAATGAAIGSAGGPVGTVIGGVAGAVTGGGVGAAGDAAGVEATDNDSTRSSYDSSTAAGTAYGSATDYNRTGARRSRSYDVSDSSINRTVGGGTIDNTAARIEDATERGLDTDLDRDGDVGRRY